MDARKCKTVQTADSNSWLFIYKIVATHVCIYEKGRFSPTV